MSIPSAPTKAWGYWCSWGVQSFSVDRGDGLLDPRIFHYAEGSGLIRHNLNETLLLHNPGWANQFPQAIRGDLYLLIDDGWDVPYAPVERWQYGSHELSPDRFPSFTGKPHERLVRLNDAVRQLGWRGLGLWVAAQVVGDGRDGQLLDDAAHEAAWRMLLRRSVHAGIAYWKVDWGQRDRSLAFRAWLTDLARQEAPDLIIEHSTGRGPLNDVGFPSELVGDELTFHGSNSGRFRNWDHGRVLEDATSTLVHSPVFRTHDVTQPLSLATTLDRVAEMLLHAPASPTETCILNCEDEVYLGAALGCSLGVMRHPGWLSSDANYDPGKAARRMHEVTRAVRWQRYAPPVSARAGQAIIDDMVLTDSWQFQTGETWAYWFVGQTFEQNAPARVARSMPLPEYLTMPSLPPFLVASRHPNGAVAIASLPRTTVANGFVFPVATVRVTISEVGQPVGVFGRFESLILDFPISVECCRVLARDLILDVEQDISSEVTLREHQLIVPGSVIEQIGMIAQTTGDISEPGLVLRCLLQ